MLTRREEKLLRGLSQRRIREAEGCFLAEGARAVEDLLASDLRTRFILHSSTLEDTERGRELLRTAARREVPLHAAPDAELAQFADTQSPQGVLAVAEVPRWSVEALSVGAGRAVILILDGIQDPGNFGTLVRTAEALGAAAVFLLPGTVDPWNPKSVRASAGSAFRLPLLPVRWEDAGGWLREKGFRILAAAAGGEPLAEVPERAALVVGNEGAGITDETRQRADAIVGIPIRGRAESLNVGAAAAILLYDLLR